jgi:hypothetical protein
LFDRFPHQQPRPFLQHLQRIDEIRDPGDLGMVSRQRRLRTVWDNPADVGQRTPSTPLAAQLLKIAKITGIFY